MQCPCHSNKTYSDCCKPYHSGAALPENALKLMRARYSAYALKEADFVMDTTHPSNPSYQEDRIHWRIEILQFSGSTEFFGLEILEFIDGEHEAFVTFLARLRSQTCDTSFEEKSRFLKVQGKWLYHSKV